PHAIALVGKKMLERTEEERAELPAARIGLGEVAVLEHAREERLGQVLGVGWIVPAAAHEREHRRPVARAEIVQRVRRSAGREHQRPIRGLKLRRGHTASLGEPKTLSRTRRKRVPAVFSHLAVQRGRDGQTFSLLLRYCRGGMPKRRLNAWLKFETSLKPTL